MRTPKSKALGCLLRDYETLAVMSTLYRQPRYDNALSTGVAFLQRGCGTVSTTAL